MHNCHRASVVCNMKSRVHELAVYGTLFGGALLCMCVLFVLGLITPKAFTITVAGILALPAFLAVHLGLRRVYLMHARRFCRKNGFAPVRWRGAPAFDSTGVKTEFSLLELDCLDAQGRRKLVRLLIWAFGVRKVLSVADYPETQDVAPAGWTNCKSSEEANP